MPWHPSLNQLRDALAELYPDVADARRVAASASLPLGRVALQGKPVNDWQVILEEAEHQGRVQAVIEMATIEYPANPVLLSAAVAYHQKVTREKSSAHVPTATLTNGASTTATPDGRPSAVTAGVERAHGSETTPASRRGLETAETKSRPKMSSSARLTTRTKAQWLLTIVTIGALGYFYVFAVRTACSNDDIMALSVLVGLPLSVFLMLQGEPYRIVWILLPLTSFLIGFPYGYGGGPSTRSPLFGLDQATDCRPDIEVLIFLIVVTVASAIDHAVFLMTSKPK